MCVSEDLQMTKNDTNGRTLLCIQRRTEVVDTAYSEHEERECPLSAMEYSRDAHKTDNTTVRLATIWTGEDNHIIPGGHIIERT